MAPHDARPQRASPWDPHLLCVYVPLVSSSPTTPCLHSYSLPLLRGRLTSIPAPIYLPVPLHRQPRLMRLLLPLPILPQLLQPTLRQRLSPLLPRGHPLLIPRFVRIVIRRLE